MIAFGKSLFMFFLLGFGLVWGQNSKELSDPPKFIIASPKEKAPSLILPKKKKSFLSEDYFNPQIEFKDPKRDIENPRLLFGQFGFNRMHGMRNSLQSLLGNQLPRIHANPIGPILNSNQRILQIDNKFLLSGRQLIHAFPL